MKKKRQNVACSRLIIIFVGLLSIACTFIFVGTIISETTKTYIEPKTVNQVYNDTNIKPCHQCFCYEAKEKVYYIESGGMDSQVCCNDKGLPRTTDDLELLCNSRKFGNKIHCFNNMNKPNMIKCSKNKIEAS